MKKPRQIAVLNAPGDRRPEDFEAMGRARWRATCARPCSPEAPTPSGSRPVKSEPEAVRRALGVAGRDDLVVVFADRIAKVAALVDFERQKEARP